jgi:hypothetical protein
LRYYYMIHFEFYLSSSFLFSPWSSNLLDPSFNECEWYFSGYWFSYS